jgi:cytidyltransferase-like protein
VRVWRELREVPADLGRTVVTIGNFDGMHRGHQHVVASARQAAGRLDVGHVVAVTFDPHPIAVLRPEHAPMMLVTVDQRLRLLHEAGVDDALDAHGGPDRMASAPPRRSGRPGYWPVKALRRFGPFSVSRSAWCRSPSDPPSRCVAVELPNVCRRVVLINYRMP